MEVYVQWGLNAFFGLTLFVFWVKLRRPPQEDPRLSRGLQLLQSKIAVLEDLSDRTEVQYNQLTLLLEEKQKSLQTKILNSETQVRKIEAAIQKSLEVANLFQDKIPHKEVIERKNTLKYIEAATLAHQGLSAEDIAQKIDLPIAELEMITKVNRNQPIFNQENLPKWAQAAVQTEEEQEPMVSVPLNTAPRHESLKKLGDEFRMACEQFSNQQKAQERLEQRIEQAPKQIFNAAKKAVEKFEFPLLGLQQRVKSDKDDNP